MGIIEKVELGEDWGNGKPLPVKIWFKKERKFAVFTIDELKEILEYWIIGEEMVYPQSKGFKGRWLLFEEIKKVFDSVEVK